MQRNSRRLPEVIYIRRRVAALVVLLVLIGSVTSILVYVNKSSSTELITATPTSTATSTTYKAEKTGHTNTNDESTTTNDTVSDSGTSTSTSEASATQLTPVKKDTCQLEDLIVEAKSDQPAYTADDQPHFYLTVRNPTTADCVIDLREQQLRFEVYDLATNTRVWSDVDCNASEDSSARTFPAESERHYEAIWSRTHSSPDSCTAREPVPAGSYLLYTLVGSNNSDGQTFNLS